VSNQAESESLNLNEPMSRDTGLSLLQVNLNNRNRQMFYHLLNVQRSRYRSYMNVSSSDLYLSIM